jgi:hypothetical protein
VLERDPFHILAEGLAGLRARVVSELGGKPTTPWTRELLGSMAALVTQCRHMTIRLECLQRNDPAGFDAFRRAMEASGDDQRTEA